MKNAEFTTESRRALREEGDGMNGSSPSVAGRDISPSGGE
jgi:hypothetical protein